MNPEKQKTNILSLPYLPKDLISLIKQTASKAGIKRIAIVGGAVRDSLYSKMNKLELKELKDLDLVVEGSASKFADYIQDELEVERLTELRIHDAFNTIEMKIDGFAIDIASARVETYSAPGKNPQISLSNLNQDLARRDFTCNAMAVCITTWALIDIFEGQASLKKKQLEFIHSNSVKDDPTRVLRGARYAARLGFELASAAQAQIDSTLEAWPWDWTPGQATKNAPPALSTRLRFELEELLNEDKWSIALSKLQTWGALKLVDEQLQTDKRLRRRLNWAHRLGIPPITALVVGAKNPIELASRLQLPIHQQTILKESIEIEKILSKILVKKEFLSWSPSQWCEEIESRSWSAPAIAISICNGTSIWRVLLRWWGRWRRIKSPISARELIQKGWQPGPRLGKELSRLRKELIDKVGILPPGEFISNQIQN